MPVKNKSNTLLTSNRLNLELQHFARGTYPVADHLLNALPVNRFFIVLKNPNGDKCRMEDEKDSLVFKEGHTYFAPLHRKCRMLLDDELEFISIHFTLELYEGVDIFSEFGRICEFQDPQWLRRAQKAFEEASEFSSALQLKGIVADFAGCLGELMSQESWESVTRFAPFKKELDYLQNRPPAQVTVDELAEFHGVSRECFSRNFTRSTGITPKKFLTRLLVSRACCELLRENILIRDIACKLGFSNEFYFSRFFSKQMGISPREYRLRAALR